MRYNFEICKYLAYSIIHIYILWYKSHERIHVVLVVWLSNLISNLICLYNICYKLNSEMKNNFFKLFFCSQKSEKYILMKKLTSFSKIQNILKSKKKLIHSHYNMWHFVCRISGNLSVNFGEKISYSKE